MNKASQVTIGKIGFVLSATLLGALTGCVGDVDPPRARGGYYQEPPPPREVVYVQPPSVQVEAFDGSAGASIRTEDDFYAPLSPYGRWEVVGSYGRCWIPGRVEADWRPYCEGYWQNTDAGWYWVSDEPWAWATYHYGCWDLSPQYGWYWVPQTQWAPAWVSWHSGGGYIGWTPRYPSGARVNSPRAYVFVEERHFTEPVRRSTVVVNNTTIINQTVINQAPSTTLIEKASGRKVRTLPAQELRHKSEATVVAQQRMPTVTSEKKAQAAVRNEARPAERKAVAAQATPQPAAVYRPIAPVPQHLETQTQDPQPVLATSKAKPASPSAVKLQARPAGNPPAPTTEPIAHQPAQKQSKPGKPSDKKMQQPANGKPANQNNEPNTADKNHENTAKE